MTATATEAAPRIYVACLASYNAGCLHGVWIDADQDAEEIWAELRAMLAASPEPMAEEWAIHDYEGFGPLRLSEYESIERVAAIAAGMAEHGDAFAAWLSCDSTREAADRESFEDAYRGEWDSVRAYADDLADDLGIWNSIEKLNCHYVTLDLDAFARDLGAELDVIESGHGTVYVFDPQ